MSNTIPHRLGDWTTIANYSFRFEDMNRLISAVKLRPVVDKVFSFEEAKQAYEHLQSQKHVGKVVIRVADE